MSRRLQHTQETYDIYVNSTNPKIQQILYNNINQCVHLDHKKSVQGHTLSNDLKKIEKDVTVSHTTTEGVYIRVHVHVHHYSKVYFDVNQFMVLVLALLELPPGSIRETKHRATPKVHKTNSPPVPKCKGALTFNTVL